jgi:photosystem II stability/assembly factor-like uncharacterized protein
MRIPPNRSRTQLCLLLTIPILLLPVVVQPFQASAVEPTIWFSLNHEYPDAVFTDVAFLNSTHGWVAGQWTEGMSGNGVVLHTTDGGDTWVTQLKSSREQMYRQIDILNADSVWVTSWGGLLHTTDDGQTWEEYPVVDGTTLMSTVEFINETHGWTATEYTLYNTTDGGETWGVVSGWSFHDVPKHMQFVSSSEVWAIGFSGIYYSNDCAATWVEVHDSGGWAVSMKDDGEGWAVADSLLMYTSNGTSWEELTVPGAAPMFRLREPYLSDIVFIGDHGWVVGDETPVMHTADYGNTWYKQSVPDSVTRRLTAVHFLNQTLGWAVGYSGAIIKTTTGDSLGTPFYDVFLPIILIPSGFLLVICSIVIIHRKMRKIDSTQSAADLE